MRSNIWTTHFYQFIVPSPRFVRLDNSDDEKRNICAVDCLIVN